MANANDQRILELKKQIEIKKEKLSKSQKFSPITNCSIELNGTRYNINVLTGGDLIGLLVKLNMYLISAKDLGVAENFLISGFRLDDWITDIKAKIDYLTRKDEERNLKTMESKLTQLLSEDKKVELEIDEIANILKG